jgi:leader peptidase (prepilin peptidase) / N-methyltransferase
MTYEIISIMPLHLTSPFCYIAAIMLGACVGSFLNVVIYRLPLDLSINNPRRSFCPNCKKEIPAWRNIPILSWLMLQGKCADCRTKIPIRYWLVEIGTAILFGASWYFFAPMIAIALWILIALLIVISLIDIDHMIIPISLTSFGAIAGLIFSSINPKMSAISELSNYLVWWQGLLDSILGWVLGFFGLWAVVLIGKIFLGKKKAVFDQAVDWKLCDATSDEAPITLLLDGEEICWWDLFFRKSDELMLSCDSIFLNGELCANGVLRIRKYEVTMPDGKIISLEKITSLSGSANKAVIPREVMGMGDPHLLGMIGAFIGGSGVLFVLCASCFYALIYALIDRIGLGKPLPYGPFLALGAITWVFGGWELWAMYLRFTSIG